MCGSTLCVPRVLDDCGFPEPPKALIQVLLRSLAIERLARSWCAKVVTSQLRGSVMVLNVVRALISPRPVSREFVADEALLRVADYTDKWMLPSADNRPNVVNPHIAGLGSSRGMRRHGDYSIAYSALASLRTGTSGSASFQRVRKSS